MKEQTIGQYRVGVSFNPSKNEMVDDIKEKTAELITLLEKFKIIKSPLDEINPFGLEGCRLITLAQDSYEEAAMWAVKAITKK